jgi:hypothetical protein
MRGWRSPTSPELRQDCAGPLEREDRDPPSRTALVHRRRGDGDCDVGLRLAVSSGPPGSRADLAAHQRLYRLSGHTLGAILLTTSLVITQWSWHCRIAGRGARIQAALGIGRRLSLFIIEAAASQGSHVKVVRSRTDVDFSGHPWLVAREHDAAPP